MELLWKKVMQLYLNLDMECRKEPRKKYLKYVPNVAITSLAKIENPPISFK